ncbi:trypsin-like serine peptidase [Paracoccus beibuensis]|uniref:hypothetical protein n=1 Tax=Paracoccus beibuensis TaxID=547602 RepID=UPI00223EC369|nr:hypothetical protein [Paracoccus beibuensis]
MGQHGLAEDIVLAALRPAFFVTESGIDATNAIATDPDLLDLVTWNGSMLTRAATGIGRIDLLHHATLPYAGTGFLIDHTLAVTNRHVALVLAERLRFGMRTGRFGSDMRARPDYHGFVGNRSQQGRGDRGSPYRA